MILGNILLLLIIDGCLYERTLDLVYGPQDFNQMFEKHQFIYESKHLIIKRLSMNLTGKRAISAKNRTVVVSLRYAKNLSTEKRPKNHNFSVFKDLNHRPRPQSSDSIEERLVFKPKQLIIKQLDKKVEKKDARQKKPKNHRKRQEQQNLSLKKKQLQNYKVKNFLGAKLERKMYAYFMFLGLAQCYLQAKFFKKNHHNYFVYVGRGNNSKLIKKIFHLRHWWTITNDPHHQNLNLVWTSFSKKTIFEVLPKEFREQKRSSPFFTKSPELAHQFGLIIPQKYKEKFRKNQQLESLSDVKAYIMAQRQKDEPFCKIKVTCNHIEGHQSLTDKKNLFFCFQKYSQNRNKSCFKFIPLTFHVVQENLEEDFGKIVSKYQDFSQAEKLKTMWVLKPGQQSNRGNGIKIFRQLEQMKKHVQKNYEKNKERTYIIQKYITPALFHRRKFDIRCFVLLIANPGINAYFYHDAYLRTSSRQYKDKNIDDKYIHLTNDAIQKKGTEYGKYEKGNKVSLEEYQKYLDFFEKNHEVKFKENILPKIKALATRSILAAVENEELNKNKIDYTFELLGYDFMLDQNYQPWLIEVNTNPCLETNCPILQNFIPSLLNNVLKLAVDPIFKPQKIHQWPLQAAISFSEIFFEPNKFQLIYGASADNTIGKEKGKKQIEGIDN